MLAKISPLTHTDCLFPKRLYARDINVSTYISQFAIYHTTARAWPISSLFSRKSSSFLCGCDVATTAWTSIIPNQTVGRLLIAEETRYFDISSILERESQPERRRDDDPQARVIDVRWVSGSEWLSGEWWIFCFFTITTDSDRRESPITKSRSSTTSTKTITQSRRSLSRYVKTDRCDRTLTSWWYVSIYVQWWYVCSVSVYL